jgi:hypothetical protein
MPGERTFFWGLFSFFGLIKTSFASLIRRLIKSYARRQEEEAAGNIDVHLKQASSTQQVII